MSWIQTFAGNVFDYGGLLRGEMQPYDLEEIAHCLSAKYRYGGHTHRLISVGEHSLRVSRRVAQLTQYDCNASACGLMHDAPETYLGDVNSPLKKFFRAQNVELYKQLEDEAERQIATVFDLHWDDAIHKVVKQADLEACAWEKQHIVGVGPNDTGWGSFLPQVPDDDSELQVFGHTKHESYNLFLRECSKLGIG